MPAAQALVDKGAWNKTVDKGAWNKSIGALAKLLQFGASSRSARLHRTQEVTGSSPASSISRSACMWAASGRGESA
jgi:hypothetical protein